MLKTSAEFEKEFIETAKEKTGKSLGEWLPVVKASGFSKPKEITDWLKDKHKLNHMQATLLSGLYLNGGKNVYQDESSLMDNQFAKCEDMRPLFEAVSEKLLSQFPGTVLIPKKTYLSYTATREFAAINVKPKQVLLGMDLGDFEFTEKIRKSKLKGPMPRISHMVILTEEKDLDKEIIEKLQESYNRSHKK